MDVVPAQILYNDLAACHAVARRAGPVADEFVVAIPGHRRGRLTCGNTSISCDWPCARAHQSRGKKNYRCSGSHRVIGGSSSSSSSSWRDNDDYLLPSNVSRSGTVLFGEQVRRDFNVDIFRPVAKIARSITIPQSTLSRYTSITMQYKCRYRSRRGERGLRSKARYNAIMMKCNNYIV